MSSKCGWAVRVWACVVVFETREEGSRGESWEEKSRSAAAFFVCAKSEEAKGVAVAEVAAVAEAVGAATPDAATDAVDASVVVSGVFWFRGRGST